MDPFEVELDVKHRSHRTKTEFKMNVPATDQSSFSDDEIVAQPTLAEQSNCSGVIQYLVSSKFRQVQLVKERSLPDNLFAG